VIGAVVGHVIDLQFGFDLTASATVFWLVLALAAFSSTTFSIDLTRKRDAPEKLGWPPYALPAVIVVAVIGLLCVRPLLADNAYWNSQQETLSPQTRQAEAERAVNLWSLEPEYHARLAEIYRQGGNWIAAEDQLAFADQLSPDDPQVWVARGNLYAYWGNIEPRRFVQAETAYRRALELAPNIATYHTALGLVLAQQGRLPDGLAELERAVALDATDGTAYRHLADLYQALGREADATQARKEAQRWINH
jgi:tetratricopeptide (TPR) repeat protein